MDTGQGESNSGADTTQTPVNTSTFKKLLLAHNTFFESGQRQRQEKGRIISPGVIDFNQNAEDEDPDENLPLYDSNATVVTNKNFKDTKWLGVKSLRFHSCTLPLNSHMTFQFSGTLVNLHFTKTIFPCNLILILQCGVYLKNITFDQITINPKKKLQAYVKCILPALTSLTFIGDRKSTSLTKHESFLLSFLTEWVIFKSLRRLNFFIHPQKSCCSGPSQDKNGARILYNFCLANSATIQQVKLPHFELNLTSSQNPSQWQSYFAYSMSSLENQLQLENEIFQRINENKSVDECKNRFLDFLGSSAPQIESLEELNKLQFSTLNLQIISPPFPKSSSLMFQILRHQIHLQFLSYCEIGGNEENLGILAQALKSSSSTLTSLSITIPYGDKIKNNAFTPNLDLTTLIASLSNLQELSILCHKRTRLVNPEGIPNSSLKMLKILGAFGLKELEKLFQALPNFQQLEYFHYANVYYYNNNSNCKEDKRTKKQEEEEDNLATGKEITPQLVTGLFTASNLKSVFILDKFTDREAIQQAVENNTSFDGVKVIPCQNPCVIQIIREKL